MNPSPERIAELEISQPCLNGLTVNAKFCLTSECSGLVEVVRPNGLPPARILVSKLETARQIADILIADFIPAKQLSAVDVMNTIMKAVTP